MDTETVSGSLSCLSRSTFGRRPPAVGGVPLPRPKALLPPALSSGAECDTVLLCKEEISMTQPLLSSLTSQARYRTASLLLIPLCHLESLQVLSATVTCSLRIAHPPGASEERLYSVATDKNGHFDSPQKRLNMRLWSPLVARGTLAFCPLPTPFPDTQTGS